VDGAVAAVAGAGALDRAEIRRTAVARFGRDRMTAEYLDTYAELLDRRR
jgi:hypothetical protein